MSSDGHSYGDFSYANLKQESNLDSSTTLSLTGQILSSIQKQLPKFPWDPGDSNEVMQPKQRDAATEPSVENISYASTLDSTPFSYTLDQVSTNRSLGGHEELTKETQKVVANSGNDLSKLMSMCQRLEPLLEQAIKITSHQKRTTEKAQLEFELNEIRSGFPHFEEKGNLDALTKDVGLTRDYALSVIASADIETLRELQQESFDKRGAMKEIIGGIGGGQFGKAQAIRMEDGTTIVAKSSKVQTKKGVDDMRAEADVYAQLGEHPNIGRCYGHFEVDGKSVLLMEHIEGGVAMDTMLNLDKYLVEKKISQTEYLAGIQHIVQGTLKALAHMEEIGFTHQDVKADNILIDDNTGEPKLIDMGLAQKSHTPVILGPYNQHIAPAEKLILQEGFAAESTWDSFSLAKLLFPMMESNVSKTPYQFVPGAAPQKSMIHEGAMVIPTSQYNKSKFLIDGMDKVATKTGENQIDALTEEGVVLGQALHKMTDEMESQRDPQNTDAPPGFYRASTHYVDFMNLISHPDPRQRMSPIQALQHPFMTEALTDGVDIPSLFSKVKIPLPPPPEKTNQQTIDDTQSFPSVSAAVQPTQDPNRTEDKDEDEDDSDSDFDYSVGGDDDSDSDFDYSAGGDEDDSDSDFDYSAGGDDDDDSLQAYFDRTAERQDTQSEGRIEDAPTEPDEPASKVEAQKDAIISYSSTLSEKHADLDDTQSEGRIDDAPTEPDEPASKVEAQKDAIISYTSTLSDKNADLDDTQTTQGSSSGWKSAAKPGQESSPRMNMGSRKQPLTPNQAKAVSDIQSCIKDLDREREALHTVFDDQRIVGIGDRGKAQGSSLHKVVAGMRAVSVLHRDLDEDTFEAFQSTLHELLSTAEAYVREHSRPLTADGKARKLAADSLLADARAAQSVLTSTRRTLEAALQKGAKVPTNDRTDEWTEAIQKLAKHPYMPPDLAEAWTKLLE